MLSRHLVYFDPYAALRLTCRQPIRICLCVLSVVVLCTFEWDLRIAHGDISLAVAMYFDDNAVADHAADTVVPSSLPAADLYAGDADSDELLAAQLAAVGVQVRCALVCVCRRACEAGPGIRVFGTTCFIVFCSDHHALSTLLALRRSAP